MLGICVARRDRDSILASLSQENPVTSKEIEEAINRLTCSVAALTFVLKNAPAGDGEPILNATRSRLYQERMDHELAEKGLS
jgi:hypothetical protein